VSNDGKAIEMLPTAFPFDVYHSLNAIGDKSGTATVLFSNEYRTPDGRGTVKRNQPNPFWLPEEIESR
jgi:hypothetical protein